MRRRLSWRFALAALLGLTGRRTEPPARTPWRAAAASGFEAPVDAVNPLQFGRAYQLPPLGRGNGVEALFWTPVARVPAQQVDAVLAALAEQDIAGWAAPVRLPIDSRGRAARLPVTGEGPHDVWASSTRSNAAEDVLMLAQRG